MTVEELKVKWSAGENPEGGILAWARQVGSETPQY